MKVSRKNLKRQIVNNLEKIDKFNVKRKNAITRKIKIQQQQKGGGIKELEKERLKYATKTVNLKKLRGYAFRIYPDLKQKIDQLSSDIKLLIETTQNVEKEVLIKKIQTLPIINEILPLLQELTDQCGKNTIDSPEIYALIYIF